MEWNRQTPVLVLSGISLAVLACTCSALSRLPVAATDEPAGDIVLPDPFDYPSPDDHAIGDPIAPVVIEEFGDFQCPFCRRFHDETLLRIVEDYVQAGKVYFVYRHFPVVDGNQPAQESHAAAAAAVCAGRQNRFWDYHDVLFANQTAENQGDFTDRRLQAMAEVLGLDAAAFNDCYGSQEPWAVVEADSQRALEAGIDATPSFLINGSPVIGAQPYQAFRQAIEAELGGG